MNTTEEKPNHAYDNAIAWLESINKMVAVYNETNEPDEIFESVLSVEVRSGWSVSADNMEPEEYRILLSYGGPSLQLTGTLVGCEIETVRLEYQDWGTPWTPVEISEAQESILLVFASCFYFGE
jgi:hypothetical protein